MLGLRFYLGTNARNQSDIIVQALRARGHHRGKLKKTCFQARKNGSFRREGVAGNLIEGGMNFRACGGDPGMKTLAARGPRLIEIIFEFGPEPVLFPEEGLPSSAARSGGTRLGHQEDQIAQRQEEERANQPFAGAGHAVGRMVADWAAVVERKGKGMD